MRHLPLALSALLALLRFAHAAPLSEISVDLRLSHTEYVQGERIRGVVNILNSSPETIRAGTAGASDLFFIEVYRASSREQIDRKAKRPFIAAFLLKTGEGQKFETFLGDHYALRQPSRYLAKPVLVHGGTRYEGVMRPFDVVTGVRVARAMQMFANRKGLSREFELVYWPRTGGENLFIRAQDGGENGRKWVTVDLGKVLRITPPKISVLKTGEVVVLHRSSRDQFTRSVFWSLPDDLEFQGNELLNDPETAGSERMKQVYRESGGIEAKKNPWWKFW